MSGGNGVDGERSPLKDSNQARYLIVWELKCNPMLLLHRPSFQVWSSSVEDFESTLGLSFSKDIKLAGLS